VWRGRAVTDGSLVKCIEEVREALGTDARQYLRNVRGRGYIFDVGLDERAHDTGMPARSEQVDLLRVIVEDEEETNGKEFITEATAPSVAVGRTGFRSRTKTNKTALAGASLLIITATAIVGLSSFFESFDYFAFDNVNRRSAISRREWKSRHRVSVGWRDGIAYKQSVMAGQQARVLTRGFCCPRLAFSPPCT